MDVFVSASKDCDDAAAKYIDTLRALGHTVSTEDTDALLAADALFLCLAGNNNSGVKADLNLLLDRAVPVAYVIEDGAEVDRGLALQLGLATRISAEHNEADLARWLKGVESKKTPRRARKGVVAACAAVFVCVAAVLIWKAAVDRTEPEPDAPVFSEQTVDEYAAYFGGAAPETLETLNLSGRGLSDIGFLSRAVNLEELDLSGNEISDISPLASLTKLKRLDLSGNQIADANVLLAMGALEWIDVSGNPIEDWTALDYLGNVEIIGAPLN